MIPQNSLRSNFEAKSNSLKQKIDLIKENIKSASVRLFNQVFSQQLKLIIDVEKVERDLNEKLMQILSRIENNESEEVSNNEDLILSDLNEIDLNLNFKPNGSVSIGCLDNESSNKDSTSTSVTISTQSNSQINQLDKNTEVEEKNDDDESSNDQMEAEETNKKQTSLTLISNSLNNSISKDNEIIRSFNVDKKIWEKIQHSKDKLYLTDSDMNLEQKAEVRRLKVLLERTVKKEFNVDTSFGRVCKTPSGYTFYNVCNCYSTKKSSTRWKMNVDISTGLCKIKMIKNRCNH